MCWRTACGGPSTGFRPSDALHVACAEAAGGEYFLTCDDQVVRCYQGGKLRVLNPVDFVVRMGGER